MNTRTTIECLDQSLPGRRADRLAWRRRDCAWAIAMALIASLPVACNTAEGIGEDFEEAGEAIQDAAD